jgi:hypothetical protein
MAILLLVFAPLHIINQVTNVFDVMIQLCKEYMILKQIIVDVIQQQLLFPVHQKSFIVNVIQHLD